MAGFASFSALLFSGVLAAAAVFAIVLHYYAQKAKRNFNHAETRLKHVRHLIGDAESRLHRVKNRLNSKADVRAAEASVSKAIAELLSAVEETEKVTAKRGGTR